MMKLISMVLMLLLLTACSEAPAAELEMVTADASPAVTAPEDRPLRYQVETDVWEDEARAEDGTPLAEYSFQLPELQVLREDGTTVEDPGTEAEVEAAAVAETFNAHFGKWAAAEEFEELAAEASETLDWYREEEIDWFGGYVLDLDTSVYQMGQLVSVSGTYYSYTGGAHPNTWRLGWNFDLSSGAFFGPEGLAADSTAFQEAMLEELLRQANGIAAENGMTPEEFFWEDYADILANWGSYAVTFDEEGMTVAFSPYELACYAAGTQIFTVSYEWLMPYLSDHGLQVLGLETAE